MVAAADLVGSTTLAAVMVTSCVALTVEGAVYDPLVRVPTDGVMAQFTPVFVVPVTVAVNCRPCDGVRVDVEGFRLTPTLGMS